MDNRTHESCNGIKRSFEVRLFRPEDADGVAQLFRSVHGEDYPIKIFYDPAQLMRANQDGDYYSIVARSAGGEIVGIHNLFRSAPSRDVYEWGVGLVLKEWRSKGVSRAIEQFMIESVIPELGMHTVFGEPVTIHLQMQKHSEKYGFEPTALEVGLMPGDAYSGEGVISSRVSTLSCFRVYRNIPQEIFVPIAYDDAMRFMYGNFASGRTFSESTEPIPSDTVSETKLDIFDFAKVARITVFEIGSDFAEHILDVESEAIRKGSIVIQLWLKLTSPWIGKAVSILQDRSYFLGGVLPQWFDDDGLLMQSSCLSLISSPFSSIPIVPCGYEIL
jgi:RimJ/RimL family protein N-acetyltransferase